MGSIKKLLRMVTKYDKSILALLTIRCFLQSISPYFNTIMTGVLIDALIADVNTEKIFWNVLVIVLGNALLALILRLFNKIISFRCFSIRNNYQKDKTLSYMQLDYAKVETAEYTDLRQNIRHSDDSMGTFMSVIDNVDTLIYDLFTFGVAVVLLCFMAFELSGMETRLFAIVPAFVIGVAVAIFLSAGVTRRFLKKSSALLPLLFDEMSKGNRRAMYFAERLIFNYSMGKDIRAYRAGNLIGREFEQMMVRMERVHKKIILSSALPGSVSNVCTGLISGALYAVFCALAWFRYVSIGNMIIYVNNTQRFINSVNSVIYTLGQFDVLASRLEPVQKLFSYASEGEGSGGGSKESSKAEGSRRCGMAEVREIRFEHVYFSYPGSENVVLHDVSFSIFPMEKVCIVGVNGAGKSTAIKLLCKLFRPSSGKITINGTDIWELPDSEYRRLVAVVFQDFKLFSFSIGENLALATEFDRGRAQAVLREVGFERDLDTVLFHEYEETGIECSGGEVQKIALARCLYADTKVVLLDEPTSALDAQSEAVVYEDFNKSSQDRIAVYISHRLSSCRFCDRVIVFDGGMVVQNGTHEDLVEQEGSVYQKLWNAQAQYYQ